MCGRAKSTRSCRVAESSVRELATRGRTMPRRTMPRRSRVERCRGSTPGRWRAAVHNRCRPLLSTAGGVVAARSPLTEQSGVMRIHPTRFVARPGVVALAVLLLLAGGTPAAAADGPSRWAWPIDGSPHVARGFEPPPRPWLAGHRGVDLTASLGTVVRAAGAGVVSFAGRVAGRGVVVVAHGGLRTTYEPVRPTVRRGEPVGLGAALGSLEVVGGHCAPRVCLHWGLRRGETYLDPLALLGQAPVRLLPLWSGAPAPPAPVSVPEVIAPPMPANAAPPQTAAPGETGNELGLSRSGRDRGGGGGAAAAGLLGAAALAVSARRRRAGSSTAHRARHSRAGHSSTGPSSTGHSRAGHSGTGHSRAGSAAQSRS